MKQTLVSFSVRQQVATTPLATFAVISDPRRRTEWQSSLSRVNLVTKGEPRLGTRWSEVTLGGVRFDLEITAFERPFRWAEQGVGRNVRAALDVQLKPNGAGTMLCVDVHLQLDGALIWLAPAIRAVMPPVLRADLRRAGQLALSSR